MNRKTCIFFTQVFANYQKETIFALQLRIALLVELKFVKYIAKVAQLVEHDLAKVGVAGSSPVFRSQKKI